MMLHPIGQKQIELDFVLNVNCANVCIACFEIHSVDQQLLLQAFCVVVLVLSLETFIKRCVVLVSDWFFVCSMRLNVSTTHCFNSVNCYGRP